MVPVSARRALHEHGMLGADHQAVHDLGGRLDAACGAARFLPAPRGRFGRPGGQDRLGAWAQPSCPGSPRQDKPQDQDEKN